MIKFDVFGRRVCFVLGGYWYKFGYNRNDASVYEHTLALSWLVVLF